MLPFVYTTIVYIMESRKKPPLSRSICVSSIARQGMILESDVRQKPAIDYTETYVIHSRMIYKTFNIALTDKAIKFSFHAYPLSKKEEIEKGPRQEEKSSLLERYKSTKKRIRCTSVLHRIGYQRDCIYIGFNSHCNREYCVRRTSASKDAVKCDR